MKYVKITCYGDTLAFTIVLILFSAPALMPLNPSETQLLVTLTMGAMSGLSSYCFWFIVIRNTFKGRITDEIMDTIS